ncbi:MAG: hypothetical protein AB8F94_23835 [Saprospiraceae bacterium]
MMNKSNFIKYWRWFIYMICGLIMILPISETLVYWTEDSNGEWGLNFVINTIEYAIFVVPLISFLWLIPRMEKPLKGIFILISILLAGFIFYGSYLSFVFLSQDYSPHYGMLLALFFFPIVLINSIVEWRQNSEE